MVCKTVSLVEEAEVLDMLDSTAALSCHYIVNKVIIC